MTRLLNNSFFLRDLYLTSAHVKFYPQLSKFQRLRCFSTSEICGCSLSVALGALKVRICRCLRRPRSLSACLTPLAGLLLCVFFSIPNIPQSVRTLTTMKLWKLKLDGSFQAEFPPTLTNLIIYSCKIGCDLLASVRSPFSLHDGDHLRLYQIINYCTLIFLTDFAMYKVTGPHNIVN
jgi:hypothetical protein